MFTPLIIISYSGVENVESNGARHIGLGRFRVHSIRFGFGSICYSLLFSVRFD